jgi:hypothetical protein
MSTVPDAPVATLLAALVDDAALVPPVSAAMPDALPAHAAHRSAAYGFLVGSFLCPASRLAELTAALAPDTPLRLTLILDTGLAGLAPALAAVERDKRLPLAAVEVALPRDGEPAAAKEYGSALGGIPSYVEVPLTAGCEAALDALAQTGCDARLRTSDPHPAVGEVASFVRACVDRQLAFRCTELRSAVRSAPDGIERHGFLNLLVATAAALDGAETDELAELLDGRDGPALVTRLGAMGGPEAEVTRGFFRSFGSCSIDEPVADLRALGVLP